MLIRRGPFLNVSDLPAGRQVETLQQLSLSVFERRKTASKSNRCTCLRYTGATTLSKSISRAARHHAKQTGPPHKLAGKQASTTRFTCLRHADKLATDAHTTHLKRDFEELHLNLLTESIKTKYYICRLWGSGGSCPVY